jgi:hypothetical protein
MLKRALSIRYDLPEVHNNLGVLYSQAEDYRSAIKEFKLALRYNNKFYQAKLNLANALRGEKQYEEAEKVYLELLKEVPTMKEVLFNLGILYLDMEREFEGRDIIQRYTDAIKYLKDYYATVDADSEIGKRVAKYIAEAEKKLKTKKDDIERERKRKLKQEEEAKKRAEAEAKYKEILPKAEEALNQKKWEEAKALFTECIKLLPDDKLARERLQAIEQNIQAEAEAKKKAEEEAKRKAKEEAKQRAINEKKYNAVIVKADAAYKKKDYETAKALYEEALSYKHDSEKAKERLQEIEVIFKKRAEEEKAKAEEQKKREAEAQAKMEEERKRAEAEAKKKAEEQKRQEEARKKAEEERAEAEAKKKAEEEAKRKAEAQPKKATGGKIEDEEEDVNKNLQKKEDSDKLKPAKPGEKIDDE